jgi:hypothetical protein
VAEQQVALAAKEEALAELEGALLQQAEEAAAEAREAAALVREEMDAAFAEERAELERDWRHTVDVRRSPPSRERERERERETRDEWGWRGTGATRWTYAAHRPLERERESGAAMWQLVASQRTAGMCASAHPGRVSNVSSPAEPNISPRGWPPEVYCKSSCARALRVGGA